MPNLTCFITSAGIGIYLVTMFQLRIRIRAWKTEQLRLIRMQSTTYYFTSLNRTNRIIFELDDHIQSKSVEVNDIVHL